MFSLQRKNITLLMLFALMTISAQPLKIDTTFNSTHTNADQELVDQLKKIFTKRGRESIRTCSLHPEICDAPILNKILNGSEFEKQKITQELTGQFFWLHNDEAQRQFASQILQPWVTEKFIDDIFEKHHSSSARANAFIDTLMPLVEQLQKLFLLKL